jgi:spermidine/putrescine transport system permease protein
VKVSLRRRESPPRGVTSLPIWLLTPSIIWLSAIFIIPVFIVFIISLGTPVGYSGVQLGFNIDAYVRIFTGPFFGVFLETLLLAGIGTALVFAVGFPTAYWLARYGGRHRYLILALLIIPFWASFLVRAFAWLIIFGSDWFIVQFVESLGLVDTFRPIGSWWAVVVVIVYNYLPLGILPLYATLERVDWRTVEASQDLGATGFGAFRQITLPSMKIGLLTSALLVFVPMTGEYVIPQIIGSGKQALYANLIGQQFLQAQNWPLGSALAVFLIITVGVAALTVLIFTQRRDN